jgi:thioredoxin 1
VFVKVDVDDLADVASKCGIRAMPTFQFYKGGSKIKEMCGANKEQLISMINECSKL